MQPEPDASRQELSNMEQNLVSRADKSQGAGNGPFLRERRMFRLLLQSNANYFGTLSDSLLPAKASICCNSYYEEISSVIWDRKAHLMAAVIALHQSSGYAGGTRLTRAPEHLRFYISLDGGEHWQDQGAVSVEVENAPGDSDRHHAVSLEPLLSVEQLLGVEVRLRVILAWEDFPPPDCPDWKPVFGDIHEAVYPAAGEGDSADDVPLLTAGLSGEHDGAMLALVRLSRAERDSRCFRHLSFWVEKEDGNGLDYCLGSVALSPDRAEQVLRLPLDLLDCRRACAAQSTLLDVTLVLSASPQQQAVSPAEGRESFRTATACLTIPPRVKAGAGEIALVGGSSAREIHVAELQLDELRDDEIIIQGVPLEGHTYIVEVSDDGLNWRPLLKSFMVTDRRGNRARHRPDLQDGQFRYLPHEKNVMGILARWDKPGSGKWQVRLRVYMQGILLPASDQVLVRVAEDASRQGGDSDDEDTGPVASCMPRDLMLGGFFPGTGGLIGF
jgi:hypothetical protein